MNEFQIYLAAAGFVPYQIKKDHETSGEWTLSTCALYWSLTIHRRWDGHHNWTLCVPLIARLRDAIWAAVTRLRDDPPQS